MSGHLNTVPDILSRLRLVSEGSSGYYAACPVHDDRTPSLSVAEGRDGRVLAFCHVCSPLMGTDEFVAEFFRVLAGTTESAERRRRMADYQAKPKRDERQWRFVRSHVYYDEGGRPVAKKDRMDVVDTSTGEVTKAFIWRHNETPKAQHPRWMPGLNGNDPGLYRAWEITNDCVVWLVEGERDADTLAEKGLVGASPPHGAGYVLTGADVTRLREAAAIRVIADDDEAGRAHGRAVAQQLLNAGMDASLWLPQEGHNDVTDMLDAGLSLDALRPIEVETEVDDVETARRLRVTRASGIVPHRVLWLWQNLVPLGECTLLAGPEGLGKSAVAVDRAAQVTRGRLPGDLQGHPRSVVIAATEDSWEHTIVPRLMAADADLDRVLRVDVVEADGLEGELSLPRDLKELADLCREHDVALVAIDPLMSRISSHLDTHKDADVRRALEPLKRFAETAGVAVLGLIHLNKGQDPNPLNRVMGSKAFTAVARSVLLVTRDRTDNSGGRRLLGQIKSNLGPVAPATMTFRLETTEVADNVDAPRVEWGGSVNQPVSDLLDEDPDAGTVTAAQQATDWLREYLTEHGPTASAQVKQDALAAGITETSLQRAKNRLRVTVENTKTVPRRTVWSLPDMSTTGD